MELLTATLVVLGLCVVPLGMPTLLGALRRGASFPAALAAGILWQVTWVVWYVVDDRPWAGSRP